MRTFFFLFFFRSHLRNFPNLAQLSEFSRRTFRILLNFPNFFRIFRMSFPNFPDELSEFCWTFLIFHPKIGEDLFFFFFFFRSHPLELSEFGSSFRIFRTNFPNFVQLSEFFPNFPDELSEFFDYFPNSRLLSEFWFTFRILAENGPGTGFLGSHFFPTLLGCVWEYMGSQSLQYGAVTLFCHNPETKE